MADSMTDGEENNGVRLRELLRVAWNAGNDEGVRGFDFPDHPEAERAREWFIDRLLDPRWQRTKQAKR